MSVLTGLVLTSILVGSAADGEGPGRNGDSEAVPCHQVEQARAGPAREPVDPVLHQEVTVSEVAGESRLVPDYTAVVRPLQLGAFLSIGGSGQPSFDPVTRTYWWER